eukprot:TRINITY_DN33158_c0_g1_i1.p1 TRINITY_DN33158_c0_g1~~TRINITY_DN33158_c0_g1_i1.p1  ORF type:complete len:403 (+),score=91.91 TRINITY_DN33158_c0_g1_i1:64-1272(+)
MELSTEANDGETNSSETAQRTTGYWLSMLRGGKETQRGNEAVELADEVLEGHPFDELVADEALESSKAEEDDIHAQEICAPDKNVETEVLAEEKTAESEPDVEVDAGAARAEAAEAEEDALPAESWQDVLLAHASAQATEDENSSSSSNSDGEESGALAAEGVSDSSCLLDLLVSGDSGDTATDGVALPATPPPLPSTPPALPSTPPRDRSRSRSPRASGLSKPQHRALAAGPSLLPVGRSAKEARKRISFKDGDNVVSEVLEIANYCGVDLWFQNPGVRVTCEWCEKPKPQLGGRLQGAEGRTRFAQCEFICKKCVEYHDDSSWDAAPGASDWQQTEDMGDEHVFATDWNDVEAPPSEWDDLVCDDGVEGDDGTHDWNEEGEESESWLQEDVAQDDDTWTW